jgi:Holliday junction resolvase-like predicted endonuclease
MSIVAVKKVGRPKADTEAVTVRVERRMLAAIDSWIAQQPDAPSRPEALRRLARKGLDL